MNENKSNVVLHRLGDHSPIVISDSKCLIRSVQKDRKVDCCAIINGPHGTAIRSYCDGVSVNGEPTAARMLHPGDEIQLPCSTRLEVKQATQLRPVSIGEAHDASDVDRQLAGLNGTQSQQVPPEQSMEHAEDHNPQVVSPVMSAMAAINAKESVEETFHSPFSSDLPAIEEQVSAQPVPAAEAVPAQTQSIETANEGLEDIFARMGVTNVGSISHPASTPHPDHGTAVAQEVPVQQAPVQPVIEPRPVADAQAPVSASEQAASMRQELESIFGNMNPEPAAPVASVEASPVAAIPTQPDPTVPSPVPASPQPTPVASQPAVAQATPLPPAAPQPVAMPQSQAVQIPAPEPVTTATPDPLAELPEDLRNQLNDLVSSLRAEEAVQPHSPNAAVSTPVAPAVSTAPVQAQPFALPATPEPQQPTPVVSEPPVVPAASAFKAPVVASNPSLPEASGVPNAPAAQQEHVIPQPAPVAPTTQAPAPMDDATVSSMLDQAIKAIQESSHTAEPPAPQVPDSQMSVNEPLAMPQSVTPVEAASAPVETAPVAVVTTPVAPAPAEQPPAEKNRSVADILGAMGMAVPGADDAGASASTSEPAFSPTQTVPEPAHVENQNVPSTPVFANMGNEPAAEQAGDEAGSEGDDDIQAYMNRLLNRTQPTAQEAALNHAPIASEGQNDESENQMAPQTVLSAEEFKPSHKATRPENYDTLREIANTSSRTAIQHSTSKSSKNLLMLKAAGSVVSLVGAGAAFWFGMTIPAGVLVIVSVLSGALCVLKK